ncbi:phosphoribosylglycinamide formyltransferase [Alkalicoccus urumqiensis]|uniref:Phosphoribosylglycinamide formyltransferase n=1 Tax=Alkalicoccus urumqiensis TaxID=1548213 RepID=A0A2P6MJ16_ALKUR|nr:phosphoribosylglycinamide formyltransferase [Alkalicoccus urumqiensis]PRO66250.1 phosphoribosylglycinamide formyltransferase [Alkalicoccus urumqiensis]
MRLAVFASGNGSNAQAVIDACRDGMLDAETVLVVSDKPDARVTERAYEAGIDCFAASPKSFDSKASFEEAVHKELSSRNVDALVLAGYMRLIGSVLLSRWAGRIVNIHPSLLPSFPGLDAIGQAVEAGVRVTGVTIHLVDEGMDTGPILAQKPVTIERGETKQEVEAAVRAVEHELYVDTLRWWLAELKEESLCQREH